jgi:cyclophilin family peptidyl-prolyl cis-trans isomerase
MMWRWASLLLVVSAAACEEGGAAGAATDASASAPPAASSSADDRLAALRKAELARRPAAVTADDLSARDPMLRRSAARALARSQSASARDGLLRLLADEDEEVVAWAAYGLGDDCAGQREATVSALVVAAASRVAEPSEPATDARLSAQRSIARAVGRCAAPASEATLVGWARRRDDHAADAIHALGDIATQHKKLCEETFVALLELAAGNVANPPLVVALYSFGRVEHLPPSVIERTLEVAKARLGDKGRSPSRLFAVRALGRADDTAVPSLQAILEKRDAHSSDERVEAARGLARLGRKGQRALGAALDALVPEAVLSGELLKSAETGLLLTLLGGITDVRGAARQALTRIARLESKQTKSDAIKRRLSLLRCAAAGLIAERDYQHPLLAACDLFVPEDKRGAHPLPSAIGARAVVAALGVDGVKITGKRLTAWRAYAEGGELRAREAALEIIARHDELDAADILAAALAAPEPGVVAAAAEVLRDHPERVGMGGKKPSLHAGVKKALLAALAGKEGTRDLESLSTVIEAAAALELVEAKERLQTICSSPQAVLRQKSHAALARLLGGPAKVKCKAPPALPLPDEMERLRAEPVTLKLASDAGELTLELDPSLSPVAVTRAAELAEKGFYDGMVVHRVVPGFVAQFGSPTHDGFGGADDRAPLPCETSPVPFTAGSVGVALAGRDTGSSQLFVTHEPTPHLDGKYALLGAGKGPWDLLVEGDVLQKVRVVD